MNTKNPIGIFDSGVGGTSIWKEIHSLLPFENTLYLADSKYAPYGNRTKEDIIALSKKNTEFLLKKGCKIIVVACNTATTNAIKELRESYEVPFIGIEPAIKPAALKSQTKNIGILATKGTLSSALFHETSKKFTKDTQIVEVVGEGLVALIEKGNLKNPEITRLLKQFLAPMLDANIDHLVLGCSHYPYLIPLLKSLLPKDVKIIDSGLAVAKQTQAILNSYALLQKEPIKPTLQFYTNSSKVALETLLAPYQEKTIIEELFF